MHEHREYFYQQSFKAPVGWLCAIFDGAHLIHRDWKQIGWKHPDSSDGVSRETIDQLTTYFAGRLVPPVPPFHTHHFALSSGGMKKWHNWALWWGQSVCT